jgi:uncharacterized lipoprotein YajG
MRTIFVLLALLLLGGCVQTPTQNTQVADDRPGLAFDLVSSAAESYTLKVDGIAYGNVGQYLAGENLLKLVDGTHQVELVSDGETVFSRKVYLGAGSNRILKVGDHE